MKINKNTIVAFILGIVISAGTIVIADNLKASDIDYKETNVDQALDDLYDKFDSDLLDRIDFSTASTYYMGNRQAGNKSSISLDKGNYIISAVNAHAWASPTKFNYKGNIGSNALSWISAVNGTCELLNGYYIEPTATDKTDDVKYVSQYTYSILYKCSFTENGTINLTTADGDYSDCTQGIILQTLKIN